MTVSLCKHSFPVQPPHGSMSRPGPCVGCGITWDDCQADLARQEAALIAGTAHEGTCARCHQPRRVFNTPSDWGRVPAPLCSRCWSTYADARASGDYVDWNDAFDNAPDEVLETALGGAR